MKRRERNASHHGSPGLSQSKSTWDLWRTTWHCGRFISETFWFFPLIISIRRCFPHSYHLRMNNRPRLWQFRDIALSHRHEQQIGLVDENLQGLVTFGTLYVVDCYDNSRKPTFECDPILVASCGLAF